MNSPDTVAIRAAAIQFSRVARAGGDPCMVAASSSILPEPLALPTAYPVVARLDPDHVLRTPQRIALQGFIGQRARGDPCAL